MELGIKMTSETCEIIFGKIESTNITVAPFQVKRRRTDKGARQWSQETSKLGDLATSFKMVHAGPNPAVSVQEIKK